MSKALHKIPLNKQDAGAIGGLEIGHITYDENSKHIIYEKDFKHSHVLSSHRDDYYILVITIKGNGLFQCDMEQLSFGANSLLLVRPYQVHAAREISEHAEAYFVSIAPFLMPDLCGNIFENLPVSKQHVKISRADKKPLVDTAALLYQAFVEANVHKTIIIHSLFNALIHRVASIFANAADNAIEHQKQPQLITQKFRQLVSEHSFLHTPSFFSEKLNITTAHLNDCIKAITGISVTNYLQNAMLLEAKRNLYYTNEDVKMIAFKLGFEDHTYFSRLFKKLTTETPLSFRKKFRE